MPKARDALGSVQVVQKEEGKEEREEGDGEWKRGGERREWW